MGQRTRSPRLSVRGTQPSGAGDSDSPLSAPSCRTSWRRGPGARKDGRGFGLHSSALAAQMLGGSLTLDSEGPGKGAVATLELPIS